MLHTFDKTTVHTDQLLFVSAAVRKKDATREHMQHVYCDGQRIYATDGHRLHLYAPEVCPLEEGYYAINKRTKTVLQLLKIDETMQYPDIDRVIPSADTDQTSFEPGRNNRGEYYSADKAVSEHYKLAQVLRATTGGCINTDYFRAACADMTDYSQEDEYSPIKLTGDKILAVIMPMRS